MDNPSGPVQRWDGQAREATDWNALRRDPELFFPNGNCLVYLYAAGTSQRGPSFRIPYDFLLYSGCRPLIEQSLLSTWQLSSLYVSNYHPGSLTPPSYDVYDHPNNDDENCSYLYLHAPPEFSKVESYAYHITTRNFFGWLLGVPIVGADPVSALLDLKIRMDQWRDSGSDNFGALFEYVKEQGYGDFEALEIEMGARLEADMAFNGASALAPSSKNGLFRTQKPQNDGVAKVWRQDSLTVRLKRKISRRFSMKHDRAKPERTHITSQAQDFQERPDRQTLIFPANVDNAVPSARHSRFASTPCAPSTSEVDAALRRLSPPVSIERYESKQLSTNPSRSFNKHLDLALQRLTGPSSTQSVNNVSNRPVSTEVKKRRRVSWANNAPTPAEERASQSDCFPTLNRLQHLQQPNGKRSRPVSYAESSASGAGQSSRHPSVRDMRTGHETCTCCGKLRKPNHDPQLAMELAKMADDSPYAAFIAAEDGVTIDKRVSPKPSISASMRGKFFKEIIIPDYGNGRDHIYRPPPSTTLPDLAPISTNLPLLNTSTNSSVSPVELSADDHPITTPTAPISAVPELDSSSPSHSPSPSSSATPSPLRSHGSRGSSLDQDYSSTRLLPLAEFHHQRMLNRNYDIGLPHAHQALTSRKASERETTMRLGPTFGAEHLDPNVSIVDEDLHSSIDALIREMEEAGISERGSALGKSHRPDMSLVRLSSEVGLPRLSAAGRV